VTGAVTVAMQEYAQWRSEAGRAGATLAELQREESLTLQVSRLPFAVCRLPPALPCLSATRRDVCAALRFAFCLSVFLCLSVRPASSHTRHSPLLSSSRRPPTPETRLRRSGVGARHKSCSGCSAWRLWWDPNPRPLRRVRACCAPRCILQRCRWQVRVRERERKRQLLEDRLKQVRPGHPDPSRHVSTPQRCSIFLGDQSLHSLKYTYDSAVYHTHTHTRQHSGHCPRASGWRGQGARRAADRSILSPL
jgi:hypothetical protein